MASASKRIAVFPASGGLGGSTLSHLLRLVPASELILIMRYPSKVPEAAVEGGAIVRAADYDHASSLDGVFNGASSLMLISYPSIQHEHRTKVHKLAIDSARQSGVTHIFYSSLAFGGDCTPNSVAQVMQAHLDTEKYLASIAAQDKSFTWTAIREGIYSESFPIYTAFFDLANPTDEILIPHDGSPPGIAWAKQDELGEATAKLIVAHAKDPSAFKFLNQTILFSGPKVLSLAESVEILGKLVGKKVHIRKVSIEQYSAQPQVQKGLTYGAGSWAPLWATAFEAIRAGETAAVTPLLGQLLGREPEPFETTVAGLVKAKTRAHA